MRSAVAALDDRERLVLSLYYERGLKYREIGLVLGISESRVCQLLRVVHARLREKMSDEPQAASDRAD